MSQPQLAHRPGTCRVCDAVRVPHPRWPWITFALALLLTGCTTWVRPPDRTDADFRTDWYACNYQANLLPRTPQSMALIPPYSYPAFSDPTLGWADTALSAITRTQCLEAKGYTQR